MESRGVLHEPILGAGTQSLIVALDVRPAEVDHQVFVQMSLGAEIATEKVKGEREEVLRVLPGPILVLAAGTVTETVGIAGKKEDHFICRLLLGGKPLHWTHLSYFLCLPSFEDDLTSTVVLKEVSEAADGMREAYLRRVNHQDLNEGQQHVGSRKGSLGAPFLPPG